METLNCSRRPGWRSNRRGIGSVLIAISLLALLGMAALSIDLGRAFYGVQRAQEVADAAALAGGAALPIESTVRSQAVTITQANNAVVGSAWSATVDPTTDIVYYAPNSTGTGLGGSFENLGSQCSAVQVTAHVYVPYYFATALGINGVNVARSAVAGNGPLSHAASAIWLYMGDGYTYGNTYNLYTGYDPGSQVHSFGLGNYSGGDTPTIVKYIEWLNLTPAEIAAATFNIGDLYPVAAGNHQAAWKQGLSTDTTSLLKRASVPPYDAQTPTSFTPDNPRIIICPLLDGQVPPHVAGFAAFWITSCQFNGSNNVITGIFLQYAASSGDINPTGAGSVTVMKLIK